MALKTGNTIRLSDSCSIYSRHCITYRRYLEPAHLGYASDCQYLVSLAIQLYY